jgi:hypothetical protein
MPRGASGAGAARRAAPGAGLMADKPAPIPQAVTELWELVVAYFKQETTEPLKSLGRVVGFGVAGSLLIGAGVVFLAVGTLRVLQEETDAFTGNWTFVPYLIVIVALIAVAGLVFAIGTRAKDSEGTS